MQDAEPAQTKTRAKREAPALPTHLEGEVRLRVAQVCALTGYGRSKLYAEISAGRFPEPERRGQRCSRWKASTVLATLNCESGS